GPRNLARLLGDRGRSIRRLAHLGPLRQVPLSLLTRGAARKHAGPSMTQRFADSDELYDFLLGFVNVERGQKTVFKLDRMRALCEGLGDPQGAYRTIHVAGSKGKGSVSAMI